MDVKEWQHLNIPAIFFTDDVLKLVIFIDNNLLPEFCRFSFNRRCDIVKFVAPVNSQTFKLKIQNVRSFSGNVIDPVEMLVEVSPGL